MSVVPLTIEVSLVFCVAALMLHRYGDYRKQHILVTVACFIAWYFSFMIIFVLPLDVSSTFYRQCIQDNTPSVKTLNPNITTTFIYESTPSTLITPDKVCEKPWSWFPETVLPVLWRVVYWTSQFLTWILLPMMQSYSNAGDFTVWRKIKSALFENAIYYGTYLLIFGICLVYVAIKPGLNINGSQLKVIGITASNTWGLFLLVLLLGYGLVDIPRSYWYASKQGYQLAHAYFKMAKLSTEKTEAEENLEDILDDIRKIAESVKYTDPMRKYIDVILEKCPESLTKNLKRNTDDYEEYRATEVVTEKSLVRIHKNIKKATHNVQRARCQWNETLQKAFELEDLEANEKSTTKKYVHSAGVDYQPVSFMKRLITPQIEWYWKCLIRPILMKILAICLCLLSFMVVWSECLFFIKKPVLSFFALFVQAAAKNSGYFYVELSSCLTITFLCFCAYSTLFKVRIFNYYYLVPDHQTNANSLIFAGMMLCRLTPPMCLNFLGLIHLDTHITKDERKEETAYTKIMGHMDVIPFISDGFNIYFPILIVLLCVATYFNLCSKALHFFGFEQFVEDDHLTQEMVDEGKDLVRRERRRLQRREDWETRRKEWNERFGDSSPPNQSQEPVESTNDGNWKSRLTSKRSSKNDRTELLKEAEPIDYNNYQLEDPTSSYSNPDGPPIGLGGYQSDSGRLSSSNYTKYGGPPRGIFDDV